MINKQSNTFAGLLQEMSRYSEDEEQITTDEVGVDDVDIEVEDSMIDTEVGSHDIDAEADNKLAEIENLHYQRHIRQVETIRSWIEQFDQLIETLNGTDDSSMQSQIAGSEEGTLFHEIFSKDSKRLSRLAQDTAALLESLKGYLARSGDYKYRGS